MASEVRDLPRKLLSLEEELKKNKKITKFLDSLAGIDNSAIASAEKICEFVEKILPKLNEEERQTWNTMLTDWRLLLEMRKIICGKAKREEYLATEFKSKKK